MTHLFDIWIGAYAKRNEVGITKLQLDTQAGKLTKVSEYSGIDNPSFLTTDSKGRYMHVVSEVLETDGNPTGELVTFELPGDSSETLREASSHQTLGGAPCYVMLDGAEKYIAVSNYMGPSVTLYPVSENGIPGPASVRFRHTGSGPNTDRQEMAHPHSAVFSLDGQFLFVPDLGLDKIMVYTLDSEQQWVGHDAVSLPPGAGPRHFKFHPSGRTAYVVNELDCTVTRFTYEQPGVLEKQESLTTLPDTFTGENTCAELVISPDGRYLYASNRGHDSLAVMKLNEASGELEGAGFVSTRGKSPRNFSITPDGGWLVAANQQSDSVVLFSIEPKSGLPIYASVELLISKPVCVHIR
ncbi:lactonase family protein [Cohnella sp.]|uniref:lactonase family protein n=1 Tax=Cohnella sp. TaxID=1883426 RepID=UPI003567216A